MANRRMFSQRITNSARFLKMTASAQALYFHLCMRADDDGVVEAFVVIQMLGSSEDDLRSLIGRNFVTVLNEDMVSVILDWNEHNLIRPDRKVDSIYKDLLVKIVPEINVVEPKKRADTGKVTGRPMDNHWTTIGPHRLGKVSLGKVNKEKKEDKEKKENYDQLVPGKNHIDQTDLFGESVAIDPDLKKKQVVDQYQDFINYFNEVTGTSYGIDKGNLTNFEYWTENYTMNQMKMAIKLAFVVDPWWKDKLTPTLIFRRSNKSGSCDYIGDLLNKYKDKYELNNA